MPSNKLQPRTATKHEQQWKNFQFFGEHRLIHSATSSIREKINLAAREREVDKRELQ